MKDVRQELFDSLEKETVGPINNKYYLDDLSGEEMLLSGVHGSPRSLYGAGMLFPQQCKISEIEDEESEDGIESINEASITEQSRKKHSIEDGDNEEDEPVGMANQFHPSAMGFTVSFNAQQLLKNDKISIFIDSSIYEKQEGRTFEKKRVRDSILDIVKRDGNKLERDYWIRKPINKQLNIDLLEVLKTKSTEYCIIPEKLSFKIYNRTKKQEKDFLTVTFVLINEKHQKATSKKNNANILYQNKIELIAESTKILSPLREKTSVNDTDEEEELRLLYRENRTFAIGHGVSVNWNKSKKEVNKITTTVIPSFELPQIAPTAKVTLSMLDLSDKGDWEKGKNSLKELLINYTDWVSNLDNEKNQLEERYLTAADKNILKCKKSLERIKRGIHLILEGDDDSDIVKCFRWMNRSMIWQQQRSKSPLRKWIGQGNNIKLEDEEFIFESLETFHQQKYSGKWRPFQIAFVLMNLESIINDESEEREIIDLIWFPTGGGKTEAYLGVTAFNIFWRRLKGNKCNNESLYSGTSIIMRYTLRLLTTQQFERASSLICACELIRIEQNSDIFSEVNLGSEKISIGLFVGGSSTPNRNKDAIFNLKELKTKNSARYPFIVMKCPCCGSQIGKVDKPTKYHKVKGVFKKDGNNGEVYFKCENNKCEFAKSHLPLMVIDEQIYENPPTLLFGTVDKFAMIPFKSEFGRLFGFREDNKNRIKPPDLIIQDELHLISGPLGTMVGLYETLIQTLCNDYKKYKYPFIESGISFSAPKIIASSATISRAYEQVKGIYGIDSRSKLNIFPAQGLKFGDTWFSEEKEISDEFPGRNYIGILAPGYPSTQTAIVRVYSSILQKIKELSHDVNEGKINYYWTLLSYFNSIRELGGTSSLVYGDIRERLGQIQNRDLIEKDKKRNYLKTVELTSRIESTNIPDVLKELEVVFKNDSSNKALDICLATNMVATGVDIQRLGMMIIHGQPKTTAEYIQASSRVGRDVPKGPGIIFTIYSPSKARDKSQYEQFQSYHSKIYANVEPTSVTPFSINTRERSLHSIFIGFIRHFSESFIKDPKIESNPKEFEDLADIISDIISERCKIIDNDELDNTLKMLNNIKKRWKNGGYQHYGDAGNMGINEHNYQPLMFSTSAEVNELIKLDNTSFPTGTSMRGVDSTSNLKIFKNG